MLRPEDVDRLPEARLEAVQNPYDEHQRERDEGHHHRVHGPALLHYAAVEDHESGHAHQADQGGRGELPRRVAWTQPVQIHRPLFPFCRRSPEDSPSPLATTTYKS